MPLPPASFGIAFLILAFREAFNMYLDVLVRFGQYLVTYLVPGVKGLPGEVYLVVTRAWIPPGCYYRMQNKYTIPSKKTRAENLPEGN